MGKYVEKTKEIIDVNNSKCNSNRFAQDFYVIGEKQQKGILVFGINPGGNENDVQNKEHPTYFNYVKGVNNRSICNNNFHKQIYDTFNKATNEDIKWDWCNYSEEELYKKEIIGETNDDDIAKIQSFRSNHLKKNFTIYVGEFFYYHDGTQGNLLDLFKNSKEMKSNEFNEYIINMIKMHIKDIEDKSNIIDLIYINNATASHWVCNALNGGKISSSFIFRNKDNGKKYKIFLGSMLSGKRSMDVFSRHRLINEIRDYLKIKQ